MVLEDSCFLSLAVVLFFFFFYASLSGLQDLLGLFFIPSWVSCICYFGFSLIFPFGLDSFFWASFIMILFRPQHRSSSNRLYSSIRLISCHMPSGGFLVNDSRSPESLRNPILKVLAITFLLSPPISLYSSQYRLA